MESLDTRTGQRVHATARLIATLLLPPGDRAFLSALFESGDRARAAWLDWTRDGDWIDPGTRRGRLAKAFAPVVLSAGERHGLALGKAASARLRAWRLVELERNARCATILHAVMAHLSLADIPVMLVGGAAAAATVYADPAHRHCQAATFDELFAGQSTAVVAGRATPVLSGAPALAHACEGVFARRGLESVRSLIDVRQLATSSPAPDWEVLIDHARRHHLALPVTTALTFWRDTGGLDVPGPVWSRLERLAARSLSRRARLVPGLAGAPRSVGALVTLAAPWRTRCWLGLAMLARRMGMTDLRPSQALP